MHRRSPISIRNSLLISKRIVDPSNPTEEIRSGPIFKGILKEKVAESANEYKQDAGSLETKIYGNSQLSEIDHTLDNQLVDAAIDNTKNTIIKHKASLRYHDNSDDTSSTDSNLKLPLVEKRHCKGNHINNHTLQCHSNIRLRSSLTDTKAQSVPRVVILERTQEETVKINIKVAPEELIELDQIEFGEVISSGAFGVIYKCKVDGIKGKNNSQFAVKLFLRDKNTGGLTEERLGSIEAELNCIRVLRHPNITEYYGILNPKSGEMGFVMEYISGGTVFDLLYSGLHVVPISRRIAWCIQLVSCIAYLHEGCSPYRFIHRDIKTINMLINSTDYSIKLCDFGNVRERTFSYCRLDNNGGSIRYMSPESLKVGAFINDKTDIWSIGCCIIEICGGGIPYKEFSDENSLLDNIHNGGLPRIPLFFPHSLSRICSKCLSIDPDMRPTASKLYRELTKLDIGLLRKSLLGKLDLQPCVQ
ncbi:protein kinase domain-containing protein [Cryptosporidium andersoni]|uniref:Protein kinase domain-containing protein n=1 Tax=Cryptosporidium andersoni TaxID=117008 RepID=A0A1J4MFX2_9CRYT|nr:protein kinase domain-containing protein [Cryptosporidium andersoni]